jgi:TPR repeat protein
MSCSRITADLCAGAVSSAPNPQVARAENRRLTQLLRGQGTAFDGQAAERWARRAAQAGKPDAQFVLGLMYARGLGVAPNRAEGLKWLRAAASKGDRQARQLLEWLLGHSEMSRS